YAAPAPVDLARKPHVHRDHIHAPLRIRASFRPALGPRLGPGSALGVGLDAFGELRAPRLAVPLFEGLVGDLALDQELRELPALGLALEWHLLLPPDAPDELQLDDTAATRGAIFEADDRPEALAAMWTPDHPHGNGNAE